ncbi:transporter substrate-binding domain-containing protein [Chelativorans sp.]|uniref:transporter substrate-binding domain-containing protein n=1 Tax=Chelativorans sp. TaxID=2203393 RepID=UPI0028124E60|nr:transporter substrate-binding domain-containing protein [Chelativorans sp.]
MASFWRRAAGAFLFLCLAACGTLAYAQAQPQQPIPPVVKVGVYVSPPFVMKDGDRYSGMAIDLWDVVSTQLHLRSTYQEFANFRELLDAVAAGRVEVAVTDVSITEDRAKVVDFTHPWFDSGLRVMVHSSPGSGLSDIFGQLADAGHLMNYALIALLILLVCGVMTIVDRRFDPEFPQRWREGLAENFYHVMSMATQGQTDRKNLFGWLGRIWQGIWMILALAVVAYITSSITSVMTASHLTNQIQNVADLQGKLVGVREGSVAEEYMSTSFADVKRFDHLAEAARALLDGELSAIVDEGPELEYYVNTHPGEPLEVVGSTFRPDKYGFAFTPGSSLLKPVSVALIGMHESGELERLRARYFGFNP